MDRRTELRYQLHPVWKRTSTKQYKTLPRVELKSIYFYLKAPSTFGMECKVQKLLGKEEPSHSLIQANSAILLCIATLWKSKIYTHRRTHRLNKSLRDNCHIKLSLIWRSASFSQHPTHGAQHKASYVFTLNFVWHSCFLG